jgi:hypothetical protein
MMKNTYVFDNDTKHYICRMYLKFLDKFEEGVQVKASKYFILTLWEVSGFWI